MPKDLKFKKTKGRIKIIKALPYKGCNVVIRQVDETLFEYILVFDSQIYSAYIEVTMKKGQTKLTSKEMIAAAGLIFTGAVTTIDEQIKMREEAITTSPITTAELQKGNREVN